MTVFGRDTTDGADPGNLIYVIKLANGAGGYRLTGAQGVVVSPDGKSVYVAGATDDALAVFTRNTSTGAITYSAVFQDPGATGAITGAGAADGLDGAQGIVVSPDGKNVYVSGMADQALVVFNRNTSTGALTHSAVFKDGVPNPVRVAISPDGKSVYVAIYEDGDPTKEIAVFNRNTSTGALTYSTVFRSSDGDIDFLDSLVVSPDNNNVYTTAPDDNAIVTLRRD